MSSRRRNMVTGTYGTPEPSQRPPANATEIATSMWPPDGRALSEMCLDEDREPVRDGLDDLVPFAFHHDPKQRLGAGVPDQDAAGSIERGLCVRNRVADLRNRSEIGLVLHPDVDQHLGDRRHASDQLRERPTGPLHEREDLQSRDQSIAGGVVIQEDEMA